MKMKKILALLLALACLLTVPAFAVSSDQLDAAINETAAWMYKTVKNPQVGSVGGEWAVLGLARSGYDVPEEYYQDYYTTVEEYVKACKGVLHTKKYTEYDRVIVALSAIGKDARDVAGYDLTYALGDYDKTIWQGMNGPIWALIALDSRGYPMPENKEAKTQATRQMYIDRILSCQLPDGGWSLFGGTAAASAGDGVSDPDITGMALQALAKYQDQPAVAKATREALDCMSKKQDPKGGFSSWGTANSESCVQIICALCELGIPLDDPRFVKNGNTLLDYLMTFYEEGGGFRHTADGSGSNQMAAEQGFYGLIAAQRLRDGKNSLYRMDDAETVSEGGDRIARGQGLETKNPAVNPVTLKEPGKTFDDVSGEKAHKNQPAIEALAARKIISGMEDGLFHPESTMTRAQFAAITVQGLGIAAVTADKASFSDVAPGAWYYAPVETASKYGIITGYTDGTFKPGGTLTRTEAAVMVARAAKLCGLDTDMDAGVIRDTLAQFTDYLTIPTWARAGVAYCYASGIWDDSALTIDGSALIPRCDVAQMMYDLLGLANLI